VTVCTADVAGDRSSVQRWVARSKADRMMTSRTTHINGTEESHFMNINIRCRNRLYGYCACANNIICVLSDRMLDFLSAAEGVITRTTCFQFRHSATPGKIRSLSLSPISRILDVCGPTTDIADYRLHPTLDLTLALKSCVLRRLVAFSIPTKHK